jgi:hypothetical protein
MLLATVAALVVASSPLLPELAAAQPAQAPSLVVVDPFRNSVHPGEALGGVGLVLGATAAELAVSWPFLLLAVRRADPGDTAPASFTAAGLLYLQLAVMPLVIATAQARWTEPRLTGGWDTAIAYGYAVELVAATVLSMAIALFPGGFWVLFGVAAAIHALGMPVATSLGLHLDRGGAAPAAPAAAAPGLAFSF